MENKICLRTENISGQGIIRDGNASGKTKTKKDGQCAEKKILIVGECILSFVILIGWIVPILFSIIFSTQEVESAAELAARYGMAFTVQNSAMMTCGEARQSGIGGFLGGRRYKVFPTADSDVRFQVEEYWYWGFHEFSPLPYADHTLRGPYWQLRFICCARR